MTDEKIYYRMDGAARKLRLVIEAVDNGSVAALRGDPAGRADLRRVLECEIARRTRPVMFRWLGQDDLGRHRFVIGREGEERRMITKHRGCWLVWEAMRLRGAELDVCGLVDAKDPAASARRMVRFHAVREFRRWRMPELEAAALACHITGTRLRYEPACNAPRFITE